MKLCQGIRICKSVPLVSSLVLHGIFIASTFLLFFQDRYIIFVSFNFTFNCYLVKVWSVSFSSSFPSKANTCQCYLRTLKPASWNISIAISFKDASISNVFSTNNQIQIIHYSSNFIRILLCLTASISSVMKINCTKPYTCLVNRGTSIWLRSSFQTHWNLFWFVSEEMLFEDYHITLLVYIFFWSGCP